MSEDPAAGGLIRKCRVALLGLPDDTGVELNHGRVGAAQGPAAFRAALMRYGVADPHGWSWPKVFDAGNVVPAAGNDEQALHATHARVTGAVRAVLDLGLLPIAVGGGHDLTFAFVRGVIEHWKARGVRIEDGISFDAHLDVRETVGSGIPMRRLIETCGVRRVQVHGLDAMANSQEHVRWFIEHGGTIETPAGSASPRGAGPDRFATFDLDVLDASIAPGVSALNPAGWALAHLCSWGEALAADPRVRCLDIMELNPAHDEQGRTARAAVRLFLHLLRGIAHRPGENHDGGSGGAAS